MRKSKTIKRTISGVLSLALLANFGTVFPIEAFADNESENLIEHSLESYGHRYQLFDSSMSWTDAESYCGA